VGTPAVYLAIHQQRFEVRQNLAHNHLCSFVVFSSLVLSTPDVCLIQEKVYIQIDKPMLFRESLCFAMKRRSFFIEIVSSAKCSGLPQQVNMVFRSAFLCGDRDCTNAQAECKLSVVQLECKAGSQIVTFQQPVDAANLIEEVSCLVQRLGAFLPL